ncbi:hypothetical protein E2C01_062670 [Portunus trituberculatus]|uniref:Uncharacterized protein n=1 Tax=Portunus trituberculatus TaxID=210409 RepID=A0A5B7HHZ1_PORTR|nr:hypothetical protein [Portunus trituberculatus]
MLSGSSSDSDAHYSGEEDDAGFLEVVSKSEKKRRRNVARLSEDSDTGKMKNAKKSHAGRGSSYGERDPCGTTVGMDASCKKRIGPRFTDTAHSCLSDSDSEDENTPGPNQGSRGLPESSRSGRQRVYFPLTEGLDYNKKLQWTVKLCKYHKDFEVLFKDGKHRPYATVKDEQAVDFLTTEGIDGLVMEKPDGREKSQKVIIYDVPTCIDPDDLPFDERYVWVK